MQRGSIDMTNAEDMDNRYHQVMHQKQQDTLDAILEYVRDIPAMKSDISLLKDDMRSVKFDVKLLQIDVRELKSDVAVLKTDVAELKSDMKGVKGRLDHIESAS